MAAKGKKTALRICNTSHLMSFFCIVKVNDDISVCNPGGGEANVKTKANTAGKVIKIMQNTARLKE